MLQLNREGLKAEELHIGSLYLQLVPNKTVTEYVRVLLYLGRDTHAQYIFYTIGYTELIDEFDFVKRCPVRYILNEDVELKYMKSKALDIVNNTMDKNGLKVSSELPKLLCSIPFLRPDELYKIFAKRKLMGLPTIEINLNQEFEDETVSKTPVKPKDLVVGNIYVTNKRYLGLRIEGQGNTYLYLGRNAAGAYIYLFLQDIPRNEKAESLYKQIDYHINKIDSLIITRVPKTVYKPVYHRSINKINCKDYLQQIGYLK